MRTIEEQIGKSKITDHDPTPILLKNFQNELAKLRKENKFDDKTYFKTYFHLMLYHHEFKELLKPANQERTIL